MESVHLAPEAVQFLNALYRPGDDGAFSGALKTYRDHCAAERRWLSGIRECSLSEQENTLTDNLSFIFDRRGEFVALAAAKPDDPLMAVRIMKLETEVAQARKALKDLRERSRMLPIDCANEFLLAAWTHLYGQTSPDVLMGYYKELFSYNQQLWERYNALSPLLHPAISQQCLSSFEQAVQGLSSACYSLSSGDRSYLEAACAQLKSAYEVIYAYLPWMTDDADRSGPGEAVPSLFRHISRLQTLSDEGRAGYFDHWTERVDFIKSEGCRKFIDRWQKAKTALFVRPSKKEELIRALDGWCSALEASLAELRCYSPEALIRFEDALRALSACVNSMEHGWEPFTFSLASSLIDTVRGIYYGTFPDMMIEDLLQSQGGGAVIQGDEARGFLEGYRREGDREALLEGLESFLEKMPGRDALAPETGTENLCPCCGTLNEPGWSGCRFCGTRFSSTSRSVKEGGGTHQITDLSTMPLPPAAEPLVQLLKLSESGECSQEKAVSLLAAYTKSVDDTEAMLKKDMSMPADQRENMTALVASLREACREAHLFLEDMDPQVLRNALEMISAASAKI